MQKDILNEVIGVEKEIQKRLETERLRAAEWIENIKREVQDEVIKAEGLFKETLARTTEDARTEAERKASEIFNAANAQADRLAEISAETLKKTLMSHISRMLPHDS